MLGQAAWHPSPQCAEHRHPNAALLFYDYFISEGQNLLVSMDYVPTNTSVHSPLKSIRIKIVDPVITLDQMDKWNKSYQDIVLKRAGG